MLALLPNGAEAGTAVVVPTVVRLAVEHRRDRLILRVTDEGRGVDPAHAASIFLPFFTTKSEGSGIGLTAARQIARGMAAIS